jgi:hypothetical protein
VVVGPETGIQRTTTSGRPRPGVGRGRRLNLRVEHRIRAPH